MRKICSVLIPSRKRYEHLYASVEKLIETASDPDNIEILIRIDDDDVGTISKISEFPKDWKVKWVVGSRYGGYKDLRFMWDELCRLSTGEFFWMWNDDCTIHTHGWDEFLYKHENKLCIIRSMHECWKYGYEAPIISKMIYNITGHFSLTTYNDDWYHHLAEEVKKIYPGFDFRVEDASTLYLTHNHLIPRQHELDGMPSQYSSMSLIEHELLLIDAKKIITWLSKHKKWERRI